MIVLLVLVVVVPIAAGQIGRALGRRKNRLIAEGDQLQEDLFNKMARGVAAQSLEDGGRTPQQAADFTQTHAEYNSLLSLLPLDARVRAEQEMAPLGGDMELRIAYLRRLTRRST